VQRFIDTAIAVLMVPTSTFATMKREGGLQNPLTYYVIGALLASAAAILWNLIGFSMPGMGRGMGHAAMGIGLLIFIPVCYLIGIFIASGIYHLVLGLFGGKNFPYETTFRVCAYALGSALPLNLIPFCGGIVGGLWALVCTVIGLAQAQETTIGKAAAAVLVPFVLCCGVILLFWAAIAALIVGGAAAGGLH
jgi:hypothetical protein